MLKVNQWKSTAPALRQGSHLPVAAPAQKRDAGGLLLQCREVAAEIWPLPCQAPRMELKRACRCAKKWVIQIQKTADGTSLLCQAAGWGNTSCRSKHHPASTKWRVFSNQSWAGPRTGAGDKEELPDKWQHLASLKKKTHICFLSFKGLRTTFLLLPPSP